MLFRSHTEKTVVRLADENGELEPGIVNPSPQLAYRSSYSYDTKDANSENSVTVFMSVTSETGVRKLYRLDIYRTVDDNRKVKNV